MVAVLPEDPGRGKLFIYLEGYFVPLSSFSSLYMVVDFLSMLYLYLFTASWLLFLCLPHMYLVAGHMLLIIHIVGSEFSTHC